MLHNIQDCLEQSGLNKEDIYSVEIVGGSSRIPSVKTLIEKVIINIKSNHLLQHYPVLRIRIRDPVLF
jgi:heat shock protein